MFHNCLIFWHHLIYEIPEGSLVMFFSQMCEFMDDNSIDESIMTLEISCESITKTKSISPTTTSPPSFGFGNFDTRILRETCSLPEFWNSMDEIFS